MPIVNLTARYVETVSGYGRRLEIRDAKVEGLELRVGCTRLALSLLRQ